MSYLRVSLFELMSSGALKLTSSLDTKTLCRSPIKLHSLFIHSFISLPTKNIHLKPKQKLYLAKFVNFI